jgi:hypothetical protein
MGAPSQCAQIAPSPELRRVGELDFTDAGLPYDFDGDGRVLGRPLVSLPCEQVAKQSGSPWGVITVRMRGPGGWGG